jgi:hypothetical protein
MHEHKGLIGVALTGVGSLESYLHLIDGICHTLIQLGTVVVIILTAWYYALKVKHKKFEMRNDK